MYQGFFIRNMQKKNAINIIYRMTENNHQGYA